MVTETLIFDLDGTISDPFEGISKSVNFALASLDFEPVDPDRIRPMIGPPLDRIFTFLIGSAEPAIIDALIAKYRERYATVGYTENILYDDIPELIATLSMKGYRLGVCTSKRTDYATAIVDMFGLLSHFEFVDGGAGIAKAMQLERLVADGLDASTAVMIGDRKFDIVAARQNAMKSVGVSWGFAGAFELEEAGADHIVNTPDELLRLFT